MRYITLVTAIVLSFVLIGTSFASEAMLQKAWVYYLSGEYVKSVNLCRLASRERMLGEEGRYLMALSFLKLGNIYEARKNFEFALNNYPKSTRKQQLLLGVADSYYIQADYSNAQEYYKRLLKSFKNTDYAAMAYLRLGECQRKEGQWRESESSLHKVVRDFPLSLEARAAKVALNKGADFFSLQVGAFSKADNAEGLARLLKRKGYDVTIEKHYANDKLVYRVKVGKFDAKEKARKEAARLKKEGFSARVCP
ncbi:MAG: SPOR domain-containing protein [Candidatus Omnitrophica bacterium]|nr:SPOR domain-containing protein [Candidatus Omnitrophota bacterium]